VLAVGLRREPAGGGRHEWLFLAPAARAVPAVTPGVDPVDGGGQARTRQGARETRRVVAVRPYFWYGPGVFTQEAMMSRHADLDQRWEISPDGKKYTFHLRRGVKFHDGADFTAEDVKATYERIASPPKGVVIPRTPLFSAVTDIVALDPYRIEFRLKEARPR